MKTQLNMSKIEIEKVVFEKGSNYFLVCGKKLNNGKEEELEMYMHYSDFNTLMNNLKLHEGKDFVYDTITSYETPDGTFYEMRILESLGQSISVYPEIYLENNLRQSA